MNTKILKLRTELYLSILIFLFSFHFSVTAQDGIFVNTFVTAPYGTKVESYANNTRITVSAAFIDFISIDCYLNIKIIGSNGITIQSLPDRQYPLFQVVTRAPVILTGHDLYEYFRPGNYSVSGISHIDLETGGLPEGEYQICAQVFHEGYPWSEPAPSGCSNFFKIYSPNPPTIMSPLNESIIDSKTIQNIVFNWIPSPGSPPWTSYKFKMVEMRDPSQTPGDAILSGLPFFETTLRQNSFLYGPGYPLLEPGLRYAFQLTAFDSESGMKFKNDGKSEVIFFTYEEKEEALIHPEIKTFESTIEDDLIEDFAKEFEAIPTTRISGRLLAKFPDSSIHFLDGIPGWESNVFIPSEKETQTITYPLPGGSSGSEASDLANTPDAAAQSGGKFNYTDLMNVGSLLNSNIGKITTTAGSGGFIASSGQLVESSSITEIQQSGISDLTDLMRKAPYYYFGNSEKIEFTRPLAKQRIKLVGRYAYLPEGSIAGMHFPVYGDPNEDEILFFYHDIYGNERNDVYKIANVVLAVAETDEDGNFSFNFTSDFFTGNFATAELEHPPIYAGEEIQTPLDKTAWIMNEVYAGTNVVSNITLSNILSIESAIGSQIAPPQQQQQKLMSGSGKILQTDRGGYLCLKIEVENPKFCSPDIDIFMMPGDNLDIPDQLALVKTYNLLVRGIASNEYNQIADPDEPMDNVRIQVFRDLEKSKNEIDVLCRFEGQKLISKTSNRYGEFKDVAIDTTSVLPNDYVYFKNLIKHYGFNPQYYAYLNVRDDVTIDKYENTKYNYKPVFVPIPDNTITSAIERPAIKFVDGNPKRAHVTYNHLFIKNDVFEFNCTMHPENPAIKARIMSETNILNIGLEDVKVDLYKNSLPEPAPYNSISEFIMQSGSGSVVSKEADKLTNEIGFFEFTNLPITVKDNYVEGPYRSIFISHPGYKRVLIPRPGYNLLNIKKGALVDFKDINLEKADTLRGFIRDEDGNPVISYIKTEYSPYYKTYPYTFLGKEHESFSIPFYDDSPRIIVEPKSSFHYGCDTVFDELPTKPIEIVLHKKLYRPEIFVKDVKGNPVTDAEVSINDITVKTNKDGIARFKFASPVDQFVMTILPPDSYSPIQQILELELSASWKRHSFIVQNSKALYGSITDKITGYLLSGVKVYSELSYNNGLRLYIETESDKNGNYNLKGIPFDATSIKIKLSKSGSDPTYVGKTETVSFPSGHLGLSKDFQIESLEGWSFADIWGYPVAIEKFEENSSNPDRAKISGYFYKLPNVQGVRIQQENLKIPFYDLTIKKTANGTAEPLSDKIPLSVSSIPFILNGTFSGELKNQKKYGSNTILNTPLEITKEGNSAVIRGMAAINLSSFNIAYSFTDNIYAGVDFQRNSIALFSADISSFGDAQEGEFNISQSFSDPKKERTKPGLVDLVAQASFSSAEFKIFSLDENLKPAPLKNYKVYGFKASSLLNEKSVLKNDKIIIPTILHTEIPTSKNTADLDLKINVGDIVITNTEVSLDEIPFSDFSFELEKWTVYGKDNWYFDKNEEALILKKVFVNTGIGIDVTLSNMRIGPNYIGETEVDIDGGINLGGIKKITLYDGLVPKFNYDNIGHYRISIEGSFSEGTGAGYISGLPEMAPGDRIEFTSIGILSNQTEALSINGSYRFYDIIDLEVNRIVTGNGYFDLVGQPNLGIPNFFPTETTMRYRLDKGKIVGEMSFLDGRIRCPGHVTFGLDKNNEAQTFTKGKYTTYGTFTVAGGNNDNDGSFTLRGFLTKTNTSCEIEVIKLDKNKLYKGDNNQIVKVGSNTIEVFDGYIFTTNNMERWSRLLYKGYSHSIEGLEDEDNVLLFNVYGDIEVSTNDIKVTNIDLGFGQMEMVYDINEARMHGTLNVKLLPMGFATLKDALFIINFDRNGYYFTAYSGLIIGPIHGWQGGLVLGNTSLIDQADIAKIKDSFEKVYLPDFFYGHPFKGIYALGDKILFDNRFDLIFVDASVKSGIGAFINCDFSSSPEVVLSGYAYADIKGHTTLSELCKVGVKINADAVIAGGYQNGAFFLDNCLSILGVGWADGLCVEPLKALGVPTSLEVSLKANTRVDSKDGFKMNISTGTCLRR